ncbi:Coenzyme F420-reducing hydrogenase alpha subunit-like protein [Methanocaldococcus infernus ME]|uniref:Coenzyme F420-reducing hydrogenase alpha subunit-like protein n=1 Tax=Methanocaldococcus infernus (strain DSM 11812 / JCM 15783 / ME) TaxID=573063 RepID=D5VUC5_METIM|nr:hypothetical protein [Methanocaldococcus infernus]ADG12737.1 Coenzyme F420-reducing hydrogenase alpha subunit-like protein [Methanocaldococcus infernus ME]
MNIPEVPQIYSRICHLNEVSYPLSIVLAIERAYSIKVPKEAEIIREIGLLGERIYSNAVKLEPFTNTKDFILLGKFIREITLGYKAGNLTVGGLYINLTKKDKEFLKKAVDEGIKKINYDFIELVEERKKKLNYNDLELVTAYKFDPKKVNGYLYNNSIVYSGALARMYYYWRIDSKNLLDILSARMIEIEFCLERIKELLRLVRGKEIYNYFKDFKGKRVGRAVIEGGESLIYTRVLLKDGKLFNIDILSGEDFNKMVNLKLDEYGRKILGFCERCHYKVKAINCGYCEYLCNKVEAKYYRKMKEIKLIGRALHISEKVDGKNIIAVGSCACDGRVVGYKDALTECYKKVNANYYLRACPPCLEELEKVVEAVIKKDKFIIDSYLVLRNYMN